MEPIIAKGIEKFLSFASHFCLLLKSHAIYAEPIIMNIKFFSIHFLIVTYPRKMEKKFS